MAFMEEFHYGGILSKNIRAFFTALIPKKPEAENLKDFRPISLISSIYKILATVSTGRLLKVLPKIISSTQGTFCEGEANSRWSSYFK